MDAPLWLFQRDEVDLLEAELDDVWEKYMRRALPAGRQDKGHGDEQEVLREYAETEDRSDTDLLLQFGGAHVEEGPCAHEEQQRKTFESLTTVDYLRQGTQRDALYAGAYAWANRAAKWAQEQHANGAPNAKEFFRLYLNALLVPVKLAFAQAGEVHEGRPARAATAADYELALIYLKRAAQSLQRLGLAPLVSEAERIALLIAERRRHLPSA